MKSTLQALCTRPFQRTGEKLFKNYNLINNLIYHVDESVFWYFFIKYRYNNHSSSYDNKKLEIGYPDSNLK